MQFWLLTTLSLAVIAVIMGTLAVLANDVPDESAKKKETKTKLSPEWIRMLAYAIMVLILLLATMYELSLFYSGPQE